MKNRTFAFIKFFIGWPLSFVALFFIAKLLFSKGNIFAQITSLNIPLLLLGLICFLIFFFLRVLFWQKLLQAKGMHFSYKDTALTWGLSEFKRYVPGNIWPIMSRTSAYSSLGKEKKAILASILQETEFLSLACFLLSLLTLNFLAFSFLPEFLRIIIPALLIVVSLLGVPFFVFHEALFPKGISLLAHFFPKLNPLTNSNLLLLMTGAFFLFGLGTYFSINAVVPLYLPHILPLIGFFVFSFLAGYLSFIAPMGLGVREGIVTAGLAKYMTLPMSALGAIFSRIVQIAAELLFLALCLLWAKISSKKLQRIEAFLLSHKYEIATLLCVGIYIAYFTLASFLRYDNFFTGRFDLGNMDQTVWNTIHGRIFQLTNPDGVNIVSRLAFHADFMLILLAPLYWIWQDPRMLLFIQSFAIGIGGIFVFLIAQKIVKVKSLALGFTISYLLYPALQYANLFDFHAVTIAVPLFLASWYAILKNKYSIAVLLLFLAATTKEEVWIIAGFFGIYFFLWKKKYVLGIVTTILSFTTFYFLFWHAIPFVRGSDHFALAYYSDFGATPTEILKTIFLSPVKTITTILVPARLSYLLELFAPVMFLPLFALPVLFFASPDLGISVLSQNAQLYSIYYHYGAIPAAFIFIASIYGFSFLQKRYTYLLNTFGLFLILIPSLFCAYLFGPFPGAKNMQSAMFVEQLSYAPLVDAFLLSIPKRYSVAATNNVGSHLSHRQKIFTIPVGLKEADIVVFLLDDSYAQPSLAAQRQMAKELDTDPLYVKLFAYKDFVVYKKKDVPTYFKRKQKGILPLFKGN